MDYQVTGKLDVNGRDLIIAGGLLVAHADREQISREEINLLIDMLLPLVEDPEEELAKIQTLAQAEDLLARSANWLRENAGREKFNMFAMLANLAAVDGVLKGNEESLLLRIAPMLGIPENAARETILNILGQNLQMQRVNRPPMQSLA
jgi:uncharacterized tellurite resistance protein B-like protein